MRKVTVRFTVELTPENELELAEFLDTSQPMSDWDIRDFFSTSGTLFTDCFEHYPVFTAGEYKDD